LSADIALDKAPGKGTKLAYYLKDLLQSLHLKYRFANLLCAILPDDASAPIRTWLYRKIGLDIAPDAFIMSNMRLVSGMEGFYEKLHIGSGVVTGARVTINLDAEVSLGKNVAIGPEVIIYTGTHALGPASQRRLPAVVARPVSIEDGCWIGLAAIILPGVTIGHGSVVAAGAVVTQHVPPNSYVEGNPAKVVKQLPWADR
jgi:maltose O-acetyltransferase